MQRIFKIKLISGFIFNFIYFGEIERVPLPLFSLLKGHDLDGHVELGVISRGNGIEEVADRVVGILRGKLTGFLGGQVLDALGALVTSKFAVLFN